MEKENLHEQALWINDKESFNDMLLFRIELTLRYILKYCEKALLRNESLSEMIIDKRCGEYYSDTLINKTKKELEFIESIIREEFDSIFDDIHSTDIYDSSDFDDDTEPNYKPSVPRILIHKKNDK